MAHTFRPAFVATLMLLLPIMATQAIAETLIIQGSTTFNRRLMEPQKGAIEAASGHELTVIPNKSTPGMIALMEGRAHMAMISASLDSEINSLRKSMPGLAYDRLQAHVIQQVRIAMVVHPSNKVRKASLNDIRKVLTGQISNWSALGGSDQPIRIVMVGGGGGLTTAVEAELLDGQHVKAANLLYMNTPVQLVQVVSQEPGAIGFAQLVLARQRGLPELATERPIEQTLSLVTVGPPTPAMQAVIEAARKVANQGM